MDIQSETASWGLINILLITKYLFLQFLQVLGRYIEHEKQEFFIQRNSSGRLILSPQEQKGLQFKPFNFMFASFVPSTEQKQGEGWNTNIHLQGKLVPSQYFQLGRAVPRPGTQLALLRAQI